MKSHHAVDIPGVTKAWREVHNRCEKALKQVAELMNDYPHDKQEWTALHAKLTQARVDIIQPFHIMELIYTSQQDSQRLVEKANRESKEKLPELKGNKRKAAEEMLKENKAILKDYNEEYKKNMTFL
jgi:hypothetical protein